MRPLTKNTGCSSEMAGNCICAVMEFSLCDCRENTDERKAHPAFEEATASLRPASFWLLSLPVTLSWIPGRCFLRKVAGEAKEGWRRGKRGHMAEVRL